MELLNRLVFYHDGFIWIIQDGVLYSKEDGYYYGVVESSADD